MLKSLKKSEVVRSIMVLLSGTVIAQLISYAFAPLISRLYSPDEMAYLALLAKIVGFFAVLSTARFELAFPLPKRDEHAFSLFRSSLSFTFLVFTASLIAVFIIQSIDSIDPILNAILYFIPFGILLVAFNTQGLNWSIRMKQFRSISVSKVLQSSLNTFLLVGFGYFSFGYYGLLYAFVLSVAFSNIPYLDSFLKAKKQMRLFKKSGRKTTIMKWYADFPKINLPHVLMDFSKELFIAFYLIYAFDKEVLGLYDFSFRMLKLPLNIIGTAISQVVFNRAAELINEGKPIFDLVKRTVMFLFLGALLPFTILFFYGDVIFLYVFGNDWQEAGVYAQLMSPWLLFNFVLSPISQIPFVIRKQKTFFFLSIISTIILVFTIASATLFPSLHLNFHTILWMASLTQAICFAVTIVWILFAVKKYKVQSA